MGIDVSFAKAYAKAQIAASQRLPKEGTVFISMNDASKPGIIPIAKGLLELGFKLVATEGTANALDNAGIQVERVLKLHEGRPNAGK